MIRDNYYSHYPIRTWRIKIHNGNRITGRAIVVELVALCNCRCKKSVVHASEGGKGRARGEGNELERRSKRRQHIGGALDLSEKP